MSVTNRIRRRDASDPDPLWSIVLAAGAGRRLAEVTGGIPKQFWSANGHRSLLEDTLERISPLAPAARTVTVVAATHRPFVRGLERPDWLGRVTYQPEDRGTAAGVLLGLFEVINAEPTALVLMTPADHGVRQVPLFRAAARRAVEYIQSGHHDVILFGTEPSMADSGYGWIVPGRTSTPSGTWPVQRVAAFVEKPSAPDAERLFASGGLWNTMVLVARATTLLAMLQARLPALTDRFIGLHRRHAAMPPDELATEYRAMVPADFSRDVVTGTAGLDVCRWPASMGWSDLGTPDRLDTWRDGHAARRGATASRLDAGRPRL